MARIYPHKVAMPDRGSLISGTRVTLSGAVLGASNAYLQPLPWTILASPVDLITIYIDLALSKIKSG